MLEFDEHAASTPSAEESFDAQRRRRRQVFLRLADRLKADEKTFASLEKYCVEEVDQRYYEGAWKTIRDVRLELMKVIEEGL